MLWHNLVIKVPCLCMAGLRSILACEPLCVYFSCPDPRDNYLCTEHFFILMAVCCIGIPLPRTESLAMPEAVPASGRVWTVYGYRHVNMVSKVPRYWYQTSVFMSQCIPQAPRVHWVNPVNFFTNTVKPSFNTMLIL